MINFNQNCDFKFLYLPKNNFIFHFKFSLKIFFIQVKCLDSFYAIFLILAFQLSLYFLFHLNRINVFFLRYYWKLNNYCYLDFYNFALFSIHLTSILFINYKYFIINQEPTIYFLLVFVYPFLNHKFLYEHFLFLVNLINSFIHLI